nr:zinc finger, CCHC-type, retrotransposon Gag domain protein [Tanacetum cinerariifolium]
MEKIFDVMGCEDAFKTRLAVYKFEGNALAWWKAYKQAKGGNAWLITVTWADFKKLFFLQFFPRAKQERLKREYHSIRQTNTETSTEFMQCFLRLAGFLGAGAGTEEEQAKNFQWCLRSNNNYSGSNNRSSGNGRDQRNRGQQSNRYANSGSQQSRGPSEGYSYLVCTTCGRRHPGE